jgi:UV DNA damage endonuclease
MNSGHKETPKPPDQRFLAFRGFRCFNLSSMKIGYPCINNSVSCNGRKTFRLASYCEEILKETIGNNLDCLQRMLEYNLKHELMFFRIGSEIVPFASHPVCKFNWQKHFQNDFKKIGDFVKKHKMRISMHPGQYTVINSPRKEVVQNAFKDLIYHTEVLDLMGLDKSAKVQIHVGGVYGDKEKAIKDFIQNYRKLPKNVKDRLAIENDDKSYSLKDCLEIHKEIGIPIIFDSFHHECINNGEPLDGAIKMAAKTWKKEDGPLMMDYSSQMKGEKKGRHSQSINIKHFKSFLKNKGETNFDLMLEIKDKEKSAVKARKLI